MAFPQPTIVFPERDISTPMQPILNPPRRPPGVGKRRGVHRQARDIKALLAAGLVRTPPRRLDPPHTDEPRPCRLRLQGTNCVRLPMPAHFLPPVPFALLRFIVPGRGRGPGLLSGRKQGLAILGQGLLVPLHQQDGVSPALGDLVRNGPLTADRSNRAKTAGEVQELS